MREMDKVKLYYNTIKDLTPIQITYQIKQRVFKNQKRRTWNTVQGITVPEWQQIQIFIPELDENEIYLGRFNTEAMLMNNIELLHEKHALAWDNSIMSHLWSFNLHYLEYLIPLAIKYKQSCNKNYLRKWIEIMSFWLQKAENSHDFFEPYTISMRIPNILICMEVLRNELNETSLEQEIYKSIYKQYKYLTVNQEQALLANHYLENLKTIVISSLAFNELDIYHKYFDLFLRQLDEQILPDGLHFERSLMYHKMVLEGIFRVLKVLRSTGHALDAEKLISSINSMADILERLERGFDRIPLFNDAGNNVSKGTASLLAAARTYCGWKKTDINLNTEYLYSGYCRFDHINCSLIFDCGEIGPRYMGGHSHNDCMSFELAVNGKILFTNSGTGQYQGNMRSFFRSTAAHNTIMIDHREQSELWGEHRVGRRIKDVKIFADKKTLVGYFRSYYGDRFCRKLRWEENILYIIDEFICYDNRAHIARQFFHLMPEYKYKKMGAKVIVQNFIGRSVAEVTVPKATDYLIHTHGILTTYAGDFGEYRKKEVLEIQTLFKRRTKVCVEIKIIGE